MTLCGHFPSRLFRLLFLFCYIYKIDQMSIVETLLIMSYSSEECGSKSFRWALVLICINAAEVTRQSTVRFRSFLPVLTLRPEPLSVLKRAR